MSSSHGIKVSRKIGGAEDATWIWRLGLSGSRLSRAGPVNGSVCVDLHNFTTARRRRHRRMTALSTTISFVISRLFLYAPFHHIKLNSMIDSKWGGVSPNRDPPALNPTLLQESYGLFPL